MNVFLIVILQGNIFLIASNQKQKKNYKHASKTYFPITFFQLFIHLYNKY